MLGASLLILFFLSMSCLSDPGQQRLAASDVRHHPRGAISRSLELSVDTLFDVESFGEGSDGGEPAFVFVMAMVVHQADHLISILVRRLLVLISIFLNSNRMCYHYSKRNSFKTCSNINPFNSDTLVPRILQHPRNFQRTFMTRHSGHKIQTRIQTTRHSPTGDNPQPPQFQTRAAGVTLPALHTLLPRITPLPRNTLPPPIRPRGKNERVLLQLVPQIETRVVDHVVLLHDVRLLEVAVARRFFADDLHLRVVIRVRGRGQTLQETGLGEDQGAGADGHQGAFFGWVGELELCEGADQIDGLAAFCEQVVDAPAAGDDEDLDREGVRGQYKCHNGMEGKPQSLLGKRSKHPGLRKGCTYVIILEVLLSVFEIDVGLDGQTGRGGHALRCSGDGAFECFALYNSSRVSMVR